MQGQENLVQLRVQHVVVRQQMHGPRGQVLRREASPQVNHSLRLAWQPGVIPRRDQHRVQSDLLEQMREPGSSVAIKTMETIKTGEFELDTR
jgi:hypothetical protein